MSGVAAARAAWDAAESAYRIAILAEDAARGEARREALAALRHAAHERAITEAHYRIAVAQERMR
jgi:hypothetical protein